MRKAGPTLLLIIILINCARAEKFRRRILAVGFSHYKILMTLGTCKDKEIFSEKKIWGSVFINRIFDIYFQSANPDYKVSRVEILIVVNSSDVLAYSKEGVGQSEFSASLYIPTNSAVIFYGLKIFTCNHPIYENSVTANVESLTFFDKSADSDYD